MATAFKMYLRLQNLPLVMFVMYRFLCETVCANNLDARYPIIFDGPAGSYFGYSVALVSNSDGNRALVSAIKGNSTHMKGVWQPGALYSCDVVNSACAEVEVDTRGNGSDEDENRQVEYVDLKDDMNLGMTLTVQAEERGRILVCAPRWQNQKLRTRRYMNGVCYVLNRNLTTTQELRPLVQQNAQVLYRRNEAGHQVYTEHYSVGEAGFSACVSPDNELVLGAPGYWDLTGTLVKYTIPTEPSGSSNLSDANVLDLEKMTHAEQYIGYAVTAGRFFRGSASLAAAGAPRDMPELRGAVYLFDFRGPVTANVKLHTKIGGEQLGSYFGAAVLAVDIDQNGFSDLLVGAPLYSVHWNGGDEGKVYVYLSDGDSLKMKSQGLLGAVVAGARFGSAISSAGDLNMDGYPDVAIGAPYENDHGAVYIYHGGKRGLQTRDVQRIEARNLPAAPRGFGIGISEGMDVDNNHYPDFVVGAYDSDRAFLLRTVPVVHTAAWIDMAAGFVSSNATKCKHSGKDFVCFPVTPCIVYDGKHVPADMDFDYKLEMDIRNAGPPRGFLAARADVHMVNGNVHAAKGKANCSPHTAYLHDEIKDVMTPFEFRLTYAISDSATDAFCKECPVIDPQSSTVVRNQTAFKLGCGDENVCFADLALHASILGHEDGLPLIVGSRSVATININAKNNEGKELAYRPRVIVELPENVDIINLAICYTNNSTVIECPLGNSLHEGQEVALSIKLNFAKVKEGAVISMRAETDSEDVNPEDNNLTLAVPFAYRADVGIEGAADVNQYAYNLSTLAVRVVHTFTILKHYESPVEGVAVTVSIPTKILGSKIPFLTLESVVADDGAGKKVGGNCNFSEATSPKRKAGSANVDLKERKYSAQASRLRSPFPKTQVRLLRLDCTTAQCTRFTCEMGPFLGPKKVGNVALSMVVNVTRITEQAGTPDTVNIVSTGTVTILDDTMFVPIDKLRAKWTEIVTSLIKEGPPAPQRLPWWAYLLIVLAGLLVLLCIILILRKCGFFRRKVMEELQEETRKTVDAMDLETDDEPVCSTADSS